MYECVCELVNMKGRLKYSTRSIALYVYVYDATFLTTTRLVFILSLSLSR
jgi:hypothetical protein